MCSYIDPKSKELRFVPKKTTELSLKPGIVSYTGILAEKLKQASNTGMKFRESKKLANVLADPTIMRGYVECLNHKVGMPLVYSKKEHSFGKKIDFNWTMKCPDCCKNVIDISTEPPSTDLEPNNLQPIIADGSLDPDLGQNDERPFEPSYDVETSHDVETAHDVEKSHEVVASDDVEPQFVEVLHDFEPQFVEDVPDAKSNMDFVKSAILNIDFAMRAIKNLKLSGDEILKKNN